MIGQFIREKISWIMLFISLQGLLIFVAYLDTSLPVSSTFYVVFLSTLIFLLFIVVRYHKETKYYRALNEWDVNLHITGMPEPRTPFEKVVHQSMTLQAEQLRGEAASNRRMIEQEKDELLAWIHEVKTPLTAMSLIIERLNDPELKASLKYEWLRIHLLLDQQLHHKRIDFLENDLYIEKTDLEELIYGEIKTVQSWCIQKGIGFDINLKVEDVLSDSKWLAFILRQLLTNAVKYSKESDIEIMSDREHGHTILKIRDYGKGIDQRDLPRIFEKGFTSTINHQNTASTGMGLYLTKKVAGTLHIDVKTESVPGEGSTFTLIFPEENEFVDTRGM
ncbi:sensor histidine kinase [Bacillus sp. Marseille-Q1617]|uniref:sensor histidine kinase n=1 Tax=Bacillus sp. Marseille-Q1617 TaxID=2736887 RepID=UPI00158C00D3|nr:sensor histidine kinase [Bacillus sp. Marseille-Q1617]